MAPPMTRWLLSILLVTYLQTFTAEGPPVPPSRPECVRPCNEKDCSADTICTWAHRLDTKTSTIYSLHWRSLNSSEEKVTSAVQQSAIILREHAPRHVELCVWVQYGSVKSEEFTFNAEDIIKPPSPKVSASHHEPLEIQWSTACDGLGLSIGSCEVRHRTEEDHMWREHESGLLPSYSLIDPMPGTVYHFQVRCSCKTGLMSDWSKTLQMKSVELAPVGKVNVWSDCGISPTNSDCYLTWKNLTGSQARGDILGYEVRISYRNGTVAQINESTAGPRNQFVYDEEKWYLSSPLKNVSSVSVCAYNALGATSPSYLELPMKGKEENGLAIHLNMNEKNLNVSWDQPSHISANPTEYVVQYKEAGRPGGQGFDWVRKNDGQVVGFTGQFTNYTPFQVSLFQISQDSEVHHVTSVIGYSLEKAPPDVPSFEVVSIEETTVSLVWEPPPLTKQNGIILNYQIGVNAEEGYNVTATSQRIESELKGLHPGQKYEVWIRAVNAAGPGPKVTRRFTTNHSKPWARPVLIGVILVVIGIFCAGAYLIGMTMCHWIPPFFNEKVPDPCNSRIFQQMTHQLFIRTRVSTSEPNLTISVLEIVERQSKATDLDELTGAGVGDGSSTPMDCHNDENDISVSEEYDKTGPRFQREGYSEIVDSDEDCCSSEEEQPGYEQHFMPTAMEIRDVR